MPSIKALYILQILIYKYSKTVVIFSILRYYIKYSMNNLLLHKDTQAKKEDLISKQSYKPSEKGRKN